jgi:hypothetical protein
MTILGPDLVTNGGFDTDTDWIKGVGWTIGSGVASCDGTQAALSNLSQDVGISTIPTLYKITYDITEYTAGNVKSRIRAVTPTGQGNTSVGSYIDYLWSDDRATTGQIRMVANVDFIGSIDNVTCQIVFNSFSNQKRDFRNKIIQWGI